MRDEIQEIEQQEKGVGERVTSPTRKKFN